MFDFKNENFLLPEGNVLISFSGGRTSGYMLNRILEVNGDLPERAKVVFANTGREMPETLDFVQECSERWSVPITWVEYCRTDKHWFNKVSHNSASRNGEPFENIIKYHNRVPDKIRRFCTQQLKIMPTNYYLKSIGWKKWKNAVGIRADEARRIKPSPVKYITYWHPLNNDKIRKPDVLDFWSKQRSKLGFDLNITTTSNCDGCFLKSEANIAAIWRAHPERMQWWVDMEEKVKGQFIYGKDYKELGNFIKRQGDWIFDDENFLCQANDGECTG